jgi:hypothetical protein
MESKQETDQRKQPITNYQSPYITTGDALVHTNYDFSPVYAYSSDDYNSSVDDDEEEIL